jgi:hypothetical protein
VESEDAVPEDTNRPALDSNADSETTRSMVPGGNVPTDSEVPVPETSKVPAPISATPDQRDAGSHDHRRTVPRDENPAVSECTVRTRHQRRRVKSHIPRDIGGQVSIVLRFAATAIVTSFTTYYGWNGLFPNTPSPKFLWDKPNNSIFVIVFLSLVSGLFISNLANAAYDRFRWIEAASRWKGIGGLDWVAWAPSTSIGLLSRLALFSPPRATWGGSRHRFFALHRLFLLGCQIAISVVLMFNVTTNTVYYPIPNTTQSGIGGVVPVSQDYMYYQQCTRTVIQVVALSDYRSTQKGFFIGSQLTVIETYPAGDPHCAPAATSCIRAYLTQAPTLNGTIPPRPNSIQEDLPYVRFLNSPIYDITFSKVILSEPQDVGLQSTYGSEGNALILASMTDIPEPDTSNSSILMGSFHILS